MEIHTQPLASPEGPSTVQSALKILRPYLPTSIPLYRRLQFGRFFPDTRLLTNLSSLSEVPGADDEPWLLAFLDRTPRPETEVWMFGSWECSTSPTTSKATEGDIDTLLTALFTRIKSLPLPPSIHQHHPQANDSEKDHTGLSRTDYTAHMLSSSLLLCGAIHERSIPAFQRTGMVKEVSTAGLVPNHEYIFNLDEPPLSDLLSRDDRDDLPEGLHWGELQYKHFALVRSRTQIPRQDRTLVSLPNVGIFPTHTTGEDPDPDPVAWAFVGLDGSLSTLQVEPEWRGKGLAKKITVKLFREKMGVFWEEGLPRLAHDYVIKGNVASVGVSNSMGGRSEWDSYWLRVALGGIVD